MRKIIIAGLLAATLTPIVASAQVSPDDRRELRRDRQDIRGERRDLNQAYRTGDRRDIRDERGDLRDARREFRDDRRDAYGDRNRNWGRNDWRAYRNTDRNLYRGGNWHSDFRYQSFRPGLRIGLNFFAPQYQINDPWRYRLPRPGYNQRWVRHYNDVLLVDVRRGIVIDVIRGFYF